MHVTLKPDHAQEIRALEREEIEATSGALIPLILGAVGLFGAGFAGGVVACNIVNDRPWWEF